MQNKTTLTAKLKKFYDFLCLLTVEPYLFAFMFVLHLKKVPTDQMVQDKICLYKYQLDSHYCAVLSTMTSDEDYLQMKSKILSDTTNYTVYSVILMTLPSVIASLFIGSWIDNYIKAKKYLLMSYYLVVLVSVLPNVISGGLLIVVCSVWSYIATTTPSHMRALRMIFAEIALGIAQPLGSFIAGAVLNTDSLFTRGQLQNYSGVFAIVGITSCFQLLWTIYMIDEKKDIRDWEYKFGINAVNNDNLMDTPELRVQNKMKSFDQHKHVHPLKLLFNFNNVREMFHTCFKTRENHVRIQIWLLFLSMCFYLLSHLGPVMFMYQFAQKVYSWDSQTYSNASAIATLVLCLATFLIAPILLKIFKLKDTTLSMIGLTSYLLMNLTRGLVLSPNGFYLSLIPGCLGSVASIGIRSHFSKIVKPEELGKVFNCLSCFEALAPLVAAGVFTSIFNSTMDTIPGLSLILVALLLIIPLGTVVWIHYFTALPDDCTNNKVMADKNGNIIAHELLKRTNSKQTNQIE
ncbi:proton-coupled folate transporter-like [Oppia nitens]|uniref:proton-coupled folate transporter-like n=1 Tax=Oppia nitens TaxID=1686743 RepID=UPI0023DA0E71|nr:proton-coupled folate transporter-like [Oppia nitens]